MCVPLHGALHFVTVLQWVPRKLDTWVLLNSVLHNAQLLSKVVLSQVV